MIRWQTLPAAVTPAPTDKLADIVSLLIKPTRAIRAMRHMQLGTTLSVGLHEDSVAVSLANAEQELCQTNYWTTEMDIRPDGDEN